MSHRLETRGWLGNNRKQWETRFPLFGCIRFCNRLSVGRISLLHHTVRGKETRFPNKLHHNVRGWSDSSDYV